jgi:hypothetical protein
MKHIITVLLIISLGAFTTANAREDIDGYSLEEVMGLEQTRIALETDIRFFFDGENMPEIIKNFGEFRTNKKSNGVGKTDLVACQRAFLSAMLSLRDRARREGGNAVIKIKSNYKGNTTSSTQTFQCGAGNIMVGVALMGTVVTLDD